LLLLVAGGLPTKIGFIAIECINGKI
jgi:hypothetical protein